MNTDYLNKIRKNSYVIIISLILTISSFSAKASHSMGSDLTYHCLGGNQYEITLSFYRDCVGIDADTGAYIVFQSSCYPADSLLIYQIAGTGQEISPVCPANTTTCNGGTFTGIQEYIYRGVITLPGPCADWQFSYNLCCRNAAITNINNPGGTLMYIYATLNNTITPCNNSPIFSNKPVPFVCLGQQFCYNHGAYDQDGDSLAYSLITPYNDASTPVTYLNPWSPTNPLSTSPALTFNSQTGDICMTPTALEVTVMAVLVQEFRNGVLIGSVERDIQVTVINCSNIIPALTGINGTNSFSQTICAGVQTCFSIYSSDPDAVQNTFVTWDNSLANATFTTLPGNRENATFCWTPTDAQINPNPYCFTVTVRDDNCPYVGNQTYAYCITVTGVNANAGPDLSVGCNTTTPLTASASGGTGVYTYQWNTGATTQSINTGPGSYVVTVSDGRCVDSDTANVAPGTATPSAAFVSNFNCSGLNVQFTDQSSIAGGSIASYAWDFGDGITSALQNPPHTFAASGNYNVQFIVTSAGGCIDTVTQLLHLTLNRPSAIYTLNNGCSGTQINFTDYSTSPTAITSWLWNFGDGSTSTVPSPAHVYTTAANYNINLVITNSDGCKDSVIHILTVYPLPTASAGVNDTICSGNPASLTATGGTAYLWNPGAYSTATINVSPTQSQTYVVTVTSAFGCTASDAASVVVRRPPQVTVQSRSICLGATATLTANVFGGGGSGPYTYWWTYGGLTTQQITVGPTVTTSYAGYITDRYGCQSYDSATVTVNAAATADAGLDQTICQGDSATLTATGGGNYQWSGIGGGAGQNAQIVVRPNTTTNYTVTVSLAGGCTATDQVQVIVAPPPIANAGPDQSVCGGTPVSLSASGGTSYNWQPGNLSGANINVTPAVNTSYIVTVTSINGCTWTDTVDIVVNSAAIADAGVDQAVCAGGSVTLTGNGGANYTWNPGNINAQQITVTPGLTSNYTLTVTDINGCQSSDQVTVVINQPPIANAGPDQSICIGANTNLLASGGVTYLWDAGNQTTSGINVNPNASTLYHVTITDNNGCTSSDSVTISVNQLPIADAGIDQAICSGANATLNATGGISYTWNPGGQTGSQLIVAPLLSTNYTVDVIDVNGCAASDQVTVNINALPIANAGIDQAICIGANATLNASGGVRFLWTPTNDTTAQITVTPNTLSNYTVVVTDINGCTSIDQVQVAINSLPTITVSSTNTLCFGSANGTATAQGSNTIGAYSYSWLPSGANTTTANGLLAGKHFVTVTDGRGCIQTDSVVVGQPSAIQLTTDSSATLCNGAADGKASVIANGGMTGYTYLWNPSGGNDSVATNLSAGNYSVTVTDANGCTQTSSVNIPQPTVLSLPMNATQPLCNGGNNGSATVNASGGIPGYNYSWAPSGGNNSIANNLSQGNYIVTITDANGCSSTNSVIVNQPSALVVATGTTPANCNAADGTATVNVIGGTPGYSYLWTPGNINTANVPNLIAGVYTIKITDNNGCTSTATANVASLGGPVINATPTGNVNCFGENNGSASVNVISGNGPFTFYWQPGNFINQVETTLPAAHYSVQVFDANGCVTIDTITISQPSAIIAGTSTTPASCNGYADGSASVVANGGVSPYTYSWSPAGGNASTASTLSADTYTVTITDNHGCTHTVNAIVNEPTGINLVMNTIPLTCFGSANGSANVQAVGGSGNYTYHWTPVGGNANVAVNLSSGYYKVSVTDINGCITYDSVFVDQPDLLTAIVTSLPVSCNGGNTGSASVVALGGTPVYTYSWSPYGGTNFDAINLGAGGFTVMVTDINGCTTTSRTIVDQSTPLALNLATVPTICIGQSIDLVAQVNGGVPPYQLLWNTADTGNSINVSPVVSTTYTVNVIDANNCVTDPATIDVNVYPPLSVSTLGHLPICDGATADIQAAGSGGNGGPYIYSWNEGSIIGDHPTVAPTNDSTFTVTLSDGCSPAVTQAVDIIVYPLPDVDFTPHVIAGCTPVTVNFQNFFPVENGSIFYWDLQDNTLSNDTNPVHTYTIPGSYNISLTIVTPEGCADTRTVNNAVTVYAYPVADFFQSSDQVSVFYPEITFTDNSANAITWQWDFGDGQTISDILQPMHSYTDTGTYRVQLIVTSVGGCIDTTYGLIRIEPEFTIFIPNSFTPNGNGVNDTFYGEGVGFVDYEMWIIDRWGKEIFHSNDKAQHWDGSYYSNDRMCQNDVYEYILNVHDYKGKLHRLIGHVTLVR